MTGIVAWNTPVKEAVFEMGVRCSEVAAKARPGQFAMIRLPDLRDPLLPRPFSIHARKDRGTFVLLYRVVGRGTELLSRCRPGDPLSVLGPLGTGFSLDPAHRTHLLIGGGMGAAPLLLLAQTGTEEHGWNKSNTRVLLGARTADEIVAREALEGLGLPVDIATDDGSEGRAGSVLSLLTTRLEEGEGPRALYVCGPWPMVEALPQTLPPGNGLTVQVSLEEHMACGIGACRGCVIADFENRPRAVCTDGPVFDLRDLHLLRTDS